MHKEHKAGEEMEVDWAGSTLSWINPETGEISLHICLCFVPFQKISSKDIFLQMRYKNIMKLQAICYLKIPPSKKSRHFKLLFFAKS